MQTIISSYLENQVGQIENLYTWDFDITIPAKYFNINITGDTWFERTVSLKRELRAYLEKNPDSSERVAHYFIKEWGGIKQFSKANEVITTFTPFQGSTDSPPSFKPNFTSVSSWSKWASLVCPEWACIYDARVAYSINAINYLNGGTHKILPSPDGRNSRLGLLDVSTILLTKKIKEGDSNNPKQVRVAHFVPKQDTYLLYLDILTSVSENLWGDRKHIHEVEMLLFALADQKIYQDLFKKVGRTRYT